MNYRIWCYNYNVNFFFYYHFKKCFINIPSIAEYFSELDDQNLKDLTKEVFNLIKFGHSQQNQSVLTTILIVIKVTKFSKYSQPAIIGR